MLKKIEIQNSGIGNLISHQITEMYKNQNVIGVNPFGELFELKCDLCNLPILQTGVSYYRGIHTSGRYIWVTND